MKIMKMSELLKICKLSILQFISEYSLFEKALPMAIMEIFECSLLPARIFRSELFFAYADQRPKNNGLLPIRKNLISNSQLLGKFRFKENTYINF